MKTLTSWIDVRPDCDFSIYNIPFGVARLQSGRKVAVSAIGDLLTLMVCKIISFLMSWTCQVIFSARATLMTLLLWANQQPGQYAIG